jgi:Na+-transporting methylmalonyl-CoA/oxaloacetate decarboxylase gamma subunit
VNTTYGIGVVLIVLSFLFVAVGCVEIFCPSRFYRGDSSHEQENSTMHIQHYEQPLIYKSLQQLKSENEIDPNKVDVHVDSDRVEDP